MLCLPTFHSKKDYGHIILDTHILVLSHFTLYSYLRNNLAGYRIICSKLQSLRTLKIFINSFIVFGDANLSQMSSKLSFTLRYFVLGLCVWLFETFSFSFLFLISTLKFHRNMFRCIDVFVCLEKKLLIHLTWHPMPLFKLEIYVLCLFWINLSIIILPSPYFHSP